MLSDPHECIQTTYGRIFISLNKISISSRNDMRYGDNPHCWNLFNFVKAGEFHGWNWSPRYEVVGLVSSLGTSTRVSLVTPPPRRLLKMSHKTGINIFLCLYPQLPDATVFCTSSILCPRLQNPLRQITIATRGRRRNGRRRSILSLGPSSSCWNMEKVWSTGSYWSIRKYYRQCWIWVHRRTYFD